MTSLQITGKEYPLAMTVAETAEYLGVSVRTVYRMIKAGTVQTRQMTPNGKLYVLRIPLERSLESPSS
jgi:excisionase family DNA binding protein